MSTVCSRQSGWSQGAFGALADEPGSGTPAVVGLGLQAAAAMAMTARMAATVARMFSLLGAARSRGRLSGE